MARLGFKKIYPAGTFDVTVMPALFASIRNTLIDSGFQVVLDTPSAIDVLRIGANPTVADDDTPHWAITFEDTGSSASISAYAVYGANHLEENARSTGFPIINPAWAGTPAPEVTLWFAADGVAGWWWVHGVSANPSSSNGLTASFGCAGVTSRRYPADPYQGISARYGLWDPWGNFYPAYAVQNNGTLNNWPWTGTWSPFGEGWYYNGQRHPGSPLPKMVVPQFPNRDGNSVCIYGEFNEILVLTDGYAQEETVLPGWVAMTGDDGDQPYAVPAPASFSVL